MTDESHATLLGALEGMVEGYQKTFKSLRPDKRNAWTFSDCYSLAKLFFEAFPIGTLVSIQKGDIKVRDIIELKTVTNDIQTPRISDVKLNAVFVRATLSLHPDKVPSLYYLADMFLLLDSMFNRNLLIVREPNDTREKRALKEAGRLAKLVSVLRYNSRAGSGSHDETIAELKGMIQKKNRTSGSSSAEDDGQMAIVQTETNDMAADDQNHAQLMIVDFCEDGEAQEEVVEDEEAEEEAQETDEALQLDEPTFPFNDADAINCSSLVSVDEAEHGDEDQGFEDVMSSMVQSWDNFIDSFSKSNQEPQSLDAGGVAKLHQDCNSQVLLPQFMREACSSKQYMKSVAKSHGTTTASEVSFFYNSFLSAV